MNNQNHAIGEDIMALAMGEAYRLRSFLSPAEIYRIDFNTLDSSNTKGLCFYGQLTGNPDGERAIQLISLSTPKVITNDSLNARTIVDVKNLIELSQIKKPVEFYSHERLLDLSNKSLDNDRDEKVIINPDLRTLYYISPLEAYSPSLKDPLRDTKIAQIKQWLDIGGHRGPGFK
jgi:hypothetical protein